MLALVAACGGGSGSAGDPASVNATPQAAGPTNAPAAAARFLTLATYGPTSAEITNLSTSTYAAWMDAQFAKPQAFHRTTLNQASADLEANVPAQLDIHLVMDNYGTHKTPTIKAWFARHPRFHDHFTPTSASWLNQVERWFATLTEKYLPRGTHRSTRQLETAIKQYLDINNANPKPFTWGKSADDILASIERFCMRISNSGH